MKKSTLITLIVSIILIIITTIIIWTNIIFNKDFEEKYSSSYDCCYDGMSEEEKNLIFFAAPCPCSDDVNIFEKTIIVLRGRRI